MISSDAVNSLDQMPREAIEVFFATNRNFTGRVTNPKFGKRFHPEGPHYLRYGRAMVKAPARWESDKFDVTSVRLAKESIPKKRKARKVLGSSEIF